MTIDADIASLVGFACEAFLYGCYTILFSLAIYQKFNSPNRQRSVNKPIFILSVLLYLTCTVRFALQFAHYYKALSTTGVDGFANYTNILLAADDLMYVIEILGQLIIIYRCWVLWSKNYWVIIVPCLGPLATIVSLSLALDFLARPHSTNGLPAKGLIPAITAMFIFLVSSGAVVTALIVIRIWLLSPRKRRDMLGTILTTGAGRTAIIIVVESGMLYLVAQLVFLVLFTLQHPAQCIAMAIVAQVNGIAPTLIFIRMFSLLNPTSAHINSRPASASGPMTMQLCFIENTTTSTDPDTLTTAEKSMPGVEWKPSGGDLGPEENGAAV